MGVRLGPMDQERLVGKLVRPALQALDYDLVRVQLSTQGDLPSNYGGAL